MHNPQLRSKAALTNTHTSGQSRKLTCARREDVVPLPVSESGASDDDVRVAVVEPQSCWTRV